jgi:hypothetical protein
MIESIGCVVHGSVSKHQYSKQTYEGKYIYRGGDIPYINISDNMSMSSELVESFVTTGGYIHNFIWCNGFSFYLVSCGPHNSPLVIKNTEQVIAKDVNPMSLIYYDKKCIYNILDKLTCRDEEICMMQFLEHRCYNVD